MPWRLQSKDPKGISVPGRAGIRSWMAEYRHLLKKNWVLYIPHIHPSMHSRMRPAPIQLCRMPSMKILLATVLLWSHPNRSTRARVVKGTCLWCNKFKIYL